VCLVGVAAVICYMEADQQTNTYTNTSYDSLAGYACLVGGAVVIRYMETDQQTN
jgi:hypothetical protein